MANLSGTQTDEVRRIKARIALAEKRIEAGKTHSGAESEADRKTRLEKRLAQIEAGDVTQNMELPEDESHEEARIHEEVSAEPQAPSTLEG